MSAARTPSAPEAGQFRTRLRIGLMLVIVVVTVVALALMRRNIAANEQSHLEREFAAAIEALRQVQHVRHLALVERARALARKPRIHAALEDGALDLLYLSAQDELRDLLTDAAGMAESGASLRARFYRFLDHAGRVISAEGNVRAGELSAAEESQLVLSRVPTRPEIGYLVHDDHVTVTELLATPVVSSETGESIAALVLGFSPVQLHDERSTALLASGIWFAGRLHLASLPAASRQKLEREIARAVATSNEPTGSWRTAIGGLPCWLFYNQLNPTSSFAPAYEVGIFPLSDMIARQRRVGWQIVAAGALLLCGGLAASHFLSVRLAAPVEQLAHESAEQRLRREQAEAALETRNAELQRAARFSADASHQLKTPVTVLRAGLEELLTKATLTPGECDEVASLIHQTYRLSGIIEDLLLLSRIDAGQLNIKFGAVNLSGLIEASLDDLGALPDELGLKIESTVPPRLHIAGEKRYITLILQNLLENARKYNRPSGRVRLTVEIADNLVRLRIANTTMRPISVEAQAHIFERFHRGAVGENIPGYGLGLNLARELARIHGGDLQLVRSDEEWTEMEVTFQLAADEATNLARQ